MVQLQDAMHGVTISAYHVDGQRVLGPIGDRFTRTGFGLDAYRGRHGGVTTHTCNSSLGFGFSNAKLGSSAC